MAGQGGVGITVRQLPSGEHMIVELVPGSAAANSPIRVGELVLAVNGVDCTVCSTDQLAEHILGPEGSVLLLQTLTPDGLSRSLMLERGPAPVPDATQPQAVPPMPVYRPDNSPNRPKPPAPVQYQAPPVKAPQVQPYASQPQAYATQPQPQAYATVTQPQAYASQNRRGSYSAPPPQQQVTFAASPPASAPAVQPPPKSYYATVAPDRTQQAAPYDPALYASSASQKPAQTHPQYARPAVAPELQSNNGQLHSYTPQAQSSLGAARRSSTVPPNLSQLSLTTTKEQQQFLSRRKSLTGQGQALQPSSPNLYASQPLASLPGVPPFPSSVGPTAAPGGAMQSLLPLSRAFPGLSTVSHV